MLTVEQSGGGGCLPDGSGLKRGKRWQQQILNTLSTSLAMKEWKGLGLKPEEKVGKLDLGRFCFVLF